MGRKRKVTQEEVEHIRAWWMRERAMPISTLAKIFNASEGTIHQILNKKGAYAEMIKSVYLIHETDGTIYTIIEDGIMSLLRLQSLVGGYIEFVSIKGRDYCVNEMGRLTHLSKNQNFEEFCGRVVEGRMHKGEFVGYPVRERK